ncbi:MAG TPA: hypothetical protein VK184_22555 [Nostocaceae cyanobacterium]|nr:hypothetical protein [Nostocaceae cyanobacterium]
MSDAKITSALLVELSSDEQQLLAGGCGRRDYGRRDDYDRYERRGYDDRGRRGDRYDDRYYNDYTPGRRPL